MTLKAHLAQLLNTRPEDLGKLFFLWALYLLFSGATQIGDGVTQTLFLKRIGVEYLPVMFAIKAALDVVVALIYVPLAARLGHPVTLTLALALSGAGLLLLWLPACQGSEWAYPALYAWNEAGATVLKIHWGVLLLDCFNEVDARRAFPVVYTGARVGAVLGGLLLTSLARPLGAANLLPVGAGLFLGSMFLSFSVRRFRLGHDLDSTHGATESAAGRISHLRTGLALGVRVPLLRAIALSTLLMVACRYGLRYEYSAAFAAAFDEADLATFYGGYMALANGASIVIQLMITSRLLVHAGITQTNLIYSIAVLAIFAGLGLWPGLLAAVLARLVENELKAAIKTPLSNLFYGALPSDQRAPGRAFVLGLMVPAATACASLLLTTTTTMHSIPLWGSGLAVLYVWATLIQNRSYRRAHEAGGRVG